MIFSRKEVAVFFAALAAAGWLLYPSEYTRGMMHRQEGDRSRAIAFFRDYLSRHPYHKGATMALAGAYEAAGSPEDALGPLLAFYRHRRGDLETGRAVLALMNRTGMDRRARDFRWELFEDLKRLPVPPKRTLEELMYQAFQDAAGRQDDRATLRALGALAEVAGDSAGYRNEMLRLMMERRQLDAALFVLRDASRRDPQNVELRRTVVRIHRLRGDVEAALRETDAALKVVPNDIGVLGDRVSIFLEAKRWAEAEAELRRLMQLEPREPAWPRELARCMIEGGRFDDGVRLLENLLVRHPSDKERWWSVVYAYADRGRHEKAAERLEAYLRRFPGDEEGLGMLVYEYQSAGRIDKAIEALKARVAAAPGDPRRRKPLIDLLLEEERFAEAAAEYRALTRLEPEQPRHWLDLAYVEETLGEPRAAVESLERYRRRFPDDPKAVEQLAGLYLELGRRSEAIELLRSHFGAKAGPPARRAPARGKDGGGARPVRAPGTAAP